MKRSLASAAACVALSAGALQAQAPAKPPASTGTISGRILAADTGKPLRQAVVTLLAQPSKTTRVAETDRNGRYEFSGLPAGRYSVRPQKTGYVVLGADPYSVGRGVEIADGEAADRVDLMLPRGGVITGRVTDEFGEPVAGAIVQAARYQFRPGGERQLMQGGFGSNFMPAGTNDLGEFRIYGLRPGSYYVSARSDSSEAVGISQTGSGVTSVESDDGLTTTFYPGTASLAGAQTVRVELMRDAHASFALVPARMARVAGTVLDSLGRPLSHSRVVLRSTTGVIGWFGNTNTQLGGNGTFALANVAPGDYVLDVRPAVTPAPGQPHRNEFVSMPVTVAGEDLDLAITSSPGISVSGRVIFEGGSNAARQVVRISAVPEDEARNVVSFAGTDSSAIDGDNRFHLPSVYGKVVFRSGFLPATVMLKAVRLNGIDITNTPIDVTGKEDITNLEVVLVDQQSRIMAYAKNARGEVQYNFRFITYPANPKPGDVTVRFQHNASPSATGLININRMPPGEYVGLAIHGVQPGEEWDPELRKRIEQFGKRFTLREGETLELDVPYVE